MRIVFCILSLGLFLGAAKAPLKFDELRDFKEKHLHEIQGKSLQTSSGVNVWKEAVRLSAQYEDKEIFQKMMSARETADGWMAEALPEYWFEVYRAKPLFYIQEALVYHKNNMEAVAGDFINEMESKKVEDLAVPLLDRESTLSQSFMRTAKKMATDKEKAQSQQLEQRCAKLTIKSTEIVVVEGTLVCAKMNVSLRLPEGCLVLPKGEKIFLPNVVQIQNWKKIMRSLCGKKQKFEGVFTTPSHNESPSFELGRQYLRRDFPKN